MNAVPVIKQHPVDMRGQSVSQAGVKKELQGGVCRLQQAELHMDRFTLQEADGQLSVRVEAGEGRICETGGERFKRRTRLACYVLVSGSDPFVTMRRNMRKC